MSKAEQTASAPGKLFLIGEYAVLEGYPATLIPAPQRARVSLTPSRGDGEVVSRTTTETRKPLATALLTEPLLAAVVSVLECSAALEKRRLVMDTRDFFRDGSKLGLGSSAALTAALVRLLGNTRDPAVLVDTAIRSHRRFQDGKGSGADIALSVFGQPVCFSRTSDQMNDGATTETVSLPTDFHILAIWTGQSASTTDYLTRMQQWRAQHPETYEQQIDHLGSLATRFRGLLLDTESRDAANTGVSAALLATIAEYNQALKSFSAISGTDFYNQVHVALQKKVESARCTYKPSGAGGGDFGLAFSEDLQVLNQLADQLKREGCYLVPLTRDVPDKSS